MSRRCTAAGVGTRRAPTVIAAANQALTEQAPSFRWLNRAARAHDWLPRLRQDQRRVPAPPLHVLAHAAARLPDMFCRSAYDSENLVLGSDFPR